jgi:hypothetical protein
MPSANATEKDLSSASDAEQGDLRDGPGAVDTEKGEVAETARVIDHAAERRLCRKFDLRILPVLAIMCKCVVLSNFPRR